MPFACYGHSMGALVAYELLRYPGDARAGLQPSTCSFRRAAHPTCEFRIALSQFAGSPAFVAELIRRYNGIPQAILAEPELLKRFLPVLRADLKIEETYLHIAGEPLDVPITAFGGSQDHRVTRENLHAWGHMTRGSFQIHVVAGGHFFRERAQA